MMRIVTVPSVYLMKHMFIHVRLLSHHVYHSQSLPGIVLTNDGNSILREIDVSHPAAKVGEVLSFD